MFGSTNFGSQPTTFGGFTNPSTTGNVFGQTPPVSSSSLFGSTNFSQQAKAPAFGVSSTASFGSPQTTSMFGQANRINGTTTGGMFTGGTSAIGGQFAAAPGQVQGTSVPFNAITGTDTMMKNGQAAPINTRHQCITCMKEYETKCLEELRFEDYQLGRKGSTQPGIFGASSPQQSTGLFSSIPAASTTTNTFGQRTTFGSPSPSGGGLFQNLNNPPKNFFSNTPTTTSSFGTSTFSFSNPSTQPAGIFGQTNNTTSTTGALANTGFSFPQPVQPQQQQPLSLFGQNKLATPAISAAPTFTGFGTTPSTTLNKPLALFGSTTNTNTTFGATPAFGTPATSTGLFGTTAPAQTKPFSLGSFGTTSQPAFGTPGNTSFSFNNPASTANLGFSSTITPSFGTSTATTGFGSTPFGTAFSLANPISNTGFGSSTFSFSNPANPSTGFSFLNSGTSNPLGQPNMQQTSSPTGPVPFATTPYKDSPLFYNLITNRNLFDMTKPTNPLAQRAIKEASKRRTSSNFNSSGTANLRNLTYPVSKNQIFNKKNSIFDGFEEEDRGTTIQILSSKSSVKKLTIKAVSAPTTRVSLPTINSFSINKATGSPVRSLNESGGFDVAEIQKEGKGNGPSESTGVFPNKRDEFKKAGEYGGGDLASRFLGVSPENSYADTSDNFTPSDGNNGIMGGSLQANICCLTSTLPGYFIQPNIGSLETLVENGRCLVRGLVIGRHNFGQVKFLDTVNVYGVNLDKIFLFRHKEVSVYPDDDDKPPVGEGINCPAEVKMERVWPIDKDTRDPIKSPARIRALCYEDRLKRACKRMGADFISYEHDAGVWVFRVPHFSKYSCVPEENEDEAESMPPPPQPSIIVKGLGGISTKELRSGEFLEPSQPLTQPPSSSTTSELNASGEGAILQPKSWVAKYHSTPTARSGSAVINVPGGQTTQLHSLGRELILASGDNESGIEKEHEIDYNPLTPSEYDSGESDGEGEVRQDRDAGTVSQHSLYGFIISDAVQSPKMSMMKSALAKELNPELDDEVSMMAASTPTKRSRPPRTPGTEKKKIRFSGLKEKTGANELNFSSIQGLGDRTPLSSPLELSSKSPLRQQRGSPGEGDATLFGHSSQEIVDMDVSQVRHCRKRDEVSGEEILLKPPESLFSSLHLYPASRGSRRLCSRVSFGPGGHIICVKPMALIESTQVAIMRVDSYAITLDVHRVPYYNRTVEEQLELQLNSQAHQLKEKSGQDKFMIEPGGNVSSQVSFLEQLRKKSPADLDTSGRHVALLEQEERFWSLCNILWPKDIPPLALSDPEFLMRQRHNLFEWFVENSPMLFEDLYDLNDTSVRGYLMRGKRLEACDQAILEDNFNLAMCLAGDSPFISGSLQCQVTQWEVEGADKFIPPPIKSLYELCAGYPIWGGINFQKMSAKEWLQHFAVYLWYTAEPHQTVQEIVTNYQCLIVDYAGSRTEDQSFPMDANPSISNLCINVLKAFAITGYSLKNVLAPTTNNPDSQNYKLSWLLMLNLEKFGGFSIEQELLEDITLGFAAQLETMGLFPWAVYVMKHLNPSPNREILIRRIIERKFIENEKDEQFLVQRLNIPKSEIYAAKAFRIPTNEKKYHHMECLIKSSSYTDAYDIFAKSVGEICFTEVNVTNWIILLDGMFQVSRFIRGWEKQGQCVYSLLSVVRLLDVNMEKEALIEVRRHVNDLFYAVLQIEPTDSYETYALLVLCHGARQIVELLADDIPTRISNEVFANFPSFENLNKKYFLAYVEEIRAFFIDVLY